MITGLVVVLFAGILIGAPIAVALALCSITPYMIDSGFMGSVLYFLRATIGAMESTPQLAIPLFILAGAIMSKGKIADKLFNVVLYFFGNVRSGLPITVIVTCLIYGAISGSAIATTAAVGGMTIPLMIKMGYNKTFAAATVAVAGGLGVLIPPSIPFVTYGTITDTSITDLFLAGVLPGCLVALCLIVYAVFYCVRTKAGDIEIIQNNYRELRAKGFWKVFKDSFFALLSPVIVLGGIYGGFVTPTEAAAISVFYSLIICVFVYKTIRPSGILGLMKDSVGSYAPLLLVLCFASAFGKIITMLQIPYLVKEWMISTLSSKWIILLVINIILLIMGMLMDCSSSLLIVAPIFLPIMMEFGMSPVQMGIIMVVNLSIGFVTPPFGVDLFVVSPMVNDSVTKVAKYALPYIGMFMIALLLVNIFPWISLALLGK